MDDSSNPFKKLSGLFPKPKTGDGTGAGRSLPAPAKSRNGLEDSPPSEREDEADLFLDAVRSIRPLKAGTKQPPSVRMAGALAEAVQTAKGTLPGPKAAGSAEPTPRLSGAAPSEAVPAADQGTGTGHTTGQTGPGVAAEPEEDLFFRAMAGVAPVSTRGREVSGVKPGPSPAPSGVDPAKLLRDILEGPVEFALYHSDEFMEGHVVGVDPAILGKLRAGGYSPEAHLDLHGMNARQAYEALTLFLKSAYQRSLRTVIVVTGRGKNSPNGFGVLRPLLRDWLTREPFKRVVLAFCSAQPPDGGPGAMYVMLRKYRKSRGKIIWERHSPDIDDL